MTPALLHPLTLGCKEPMALPILYSTGSLPMGHDPLGIEGPLVTGIA